MSQSIFIDESNGNGVFAVKASNNSTVPITNSVIQNNFNSTVLVNSISSEDLSQSLSEYTDADESMSAPTEFLAEFLSSVMLKDYERALKYCKLILEYEPNNATAKEFYPLIQEKLKSGNTAANESDENDNRSSSGDLEVEDMKLEDSEDEDDDDIAVTSSSSSSSSNNSNNDSVDDETSEDSDENIQKASDAGSSAGNSENTTHSYSSLLLEEEEDEPPNNLLHIKDLSSSHLDASNGNLISASCSDSESPTEPLTQRLAAILLSKYVPGKKN